MISEPLRCHLQFEARGADFSFGCDSRRLDSPHGSGLAQPGPNRGSDWKTGWNQEYVHHQDSIDAWQSHWRNRVGQISTEFLIKALVTLSSRDIVIPSSLPKPGSLQKKNAFQRSVQSSASKTTDLFIFCQLLTWKIVYVWLCLNQVWNKYY